ncbi:MAG: glycosyltransferase family 2 protein [Mycobacteriales bacterium]
MLPPEGSQPALLVIILNWNCAADALKAARACGRSQGIDVDVLVVDNGSADDSVSVLTDHLEPGQLLCLPTNLGFGGGVNRGVATAVERGYDEVCLLNADAEVADDALRLMVDRLRTDPRTGAVAAKILEAGTEAVQTAGGGTVSWLTGRAAVALLDDEPLDFLGGTCLVLRTLAFTEVGGFDERFFMYWEDADLSLRLAASGWGLAYAAEAVAVHAGGSALGRASAVAQRQYLTSMVLFFKKHRRAWLLPVVLRLASSAVERVLRADRPGLRAVLQASREVTATRGSAGVRGPA